MNGAADAPSSLVRCCSVMEVEEREIISERIHGSSPLDSYDHTSVPASIVAAAYYYYYGGGD